MTDLSTVIRESVGATRRFLRELPAAQITSIAVCSDTVRRLVDEDEKLYLGSSAAGLSFCGYPVTMKAEPGYAVHWEEL